MAGTASCQFYAEVVRMSWYFFIEVNMEFSNSVCILWIHSLTLYFRYMNRNYKLDKETTQRLLDLAVEDNLVKLHKKVGTKGEPF